MNAIDAGRPRSYVDGPGLPSVAGPAVGLLRGLTLGCAGAVVVLLTLALSNGPTLAALRQGRMLPVGISSLLLALAGLAGTWMMARARRHAGSAAVPLAGGRRRLLSRIRPVGGDPGLIGRTARWPQAMLIAGLTVAAVACAWLLPSRPDLTVAPSVDFLIGGAAIVLTFPMLIVERMFAGLMGERRLAGVADKRRAAVPMSSAMPDGRVAEAASVRALALLPVIAWPAAGLAQIAAGLGVPFAPRFDSCVLMLLTLVAAELCLRALGRCFLPPPAAADARAAIDSVLVQILADGLRTRSLAAPVRQHFGIDFSRSWALSYLRAATPPVVLFLLVLCWGLSGVVLVGLDQRAVYERFGAPVAVLHPGLHAILPWPMGQVRRVEFGVIHDMTLGNDMILGDASGTIVYRKVGAEDLPPPDADRLWEQAHPAELTFLIASSSGGKQSFQVVSADIKLRYRVGLTDVDALHAVYRVADPAAVLRGSAGRVIAGFFAGRTLDQVLGENREAMAERLQAALQADLDRVDCGLRLAGVVIEAIHPPAGAAEAYHAVQAAQILAETSVSAERGSAFASRAKASQYATDITTQAAAAAAETVGTAAADLTRFTADHAAATASGDSFLLERRLAAITGSLPKADLTIIDHRIPEADAPTVDLRAFSPAVARSAGHDQE
jgi:regulator of protease activity HflC (stomatin/prohibitin superfamily)